MTSHRIYVLLREPLGPWLDEPEEGLGKSRTGLLTERHLPWRDLLDELLDGLPDTSGGAVGGVSAPLNGDRTRQIARLVTHYVSHHDRDGSPNSRSLLPSGADAIYRGGPRVGQNFADLTRFSRGSARFDLTSVLLGNYSRRPRAHPHKLFYSCTDLAAVSKLYCRLLGVGMNQRVEQVGATEVRTPLFVWGHYLPAGGERREFVNTPGRGKPFPAIAKVALHSWNILPHGFQGLVYDVLYMPIFSDPPAPFILAGEHPAGGILGLTDYRRLMFDRFATIHGQPVKEPVDDLDLDFQ